VDRKNKDSRRDSFKKMKDVLTMGMHMCIYPEGTRNKTGEPLKTFHDGAFKLAVETRKSLLPAIMFNTNKVLPTGKTFFFWPSRMEIHFLQPYAVNNADTFEDLKQGMFLLMSEYYTKHYKAS
jgi:1-acyl-sn-glycerol-3-phosphate acyltransferase